jgi:hypothetical protein
MLKNYGQQDNWSFIAAKIMELRSYMVVDFPASFDWRFSMGLGLQPKGGFCHET